MVEGGLGNHLMVIVEGQGVAQLRLDQGLMSLGLVGPSEVVGWWSLLDGQLYPASVTALTPMRVAAFEVSGLTLLMNLDSGIGYPIHRRLRGIVFLQYQTALQAIKTAVKRVDRRPIRQSVGSGWTTAALRTTRFFAAVQNGKLLARDKTKSDCWLDAIRQSFA